MLSEEDISLNDEDDDGDGVEEEEEEEDRHEYYQDSEYARQLSGKESQLDRRHNIASHCESEVYNRYKYQNLTRNNNNFTTSTTTTTNNKNINNQNQKIQLFDNNYSDILSTNTTNRQNLSFDETIFRVKRVVDDDENEETSATSTSLIAFR